MGPADTQVAFENCAQLIKCITKLTGLLKNPDVRETGFRKLKKKTN